MTGAKVLVENNLNKEKLLSDNESLNIEKLSVVDKSFEEIKVRRFVNISKNIKIR